MKFINIFIMSSVINHFSLISDTFDTTVVQLPSMKIKFMLLNPSRQK